MAEALVDIIKTKLREAIQQNFGITVESIASEIPPRTELGDLAFPVCFELAKQIKATTGQKANPRQLAEKLVPILRESDPRISRVEIAGPGYLNFFYDRSAYLKVALAQTDIRPETENEKVIVEHTSINPNKAAHIGHLRNAVLGDTIVRLLRAWAKSSKSKITSITQAFRLPMSSSVSKTWNRRPWMRSNRSKANSITIAGICMHASVNGTKVRPNGKSYARERFTSWKNRITKRPRWRNIFRQLFSVIIWIRWRGSALFTMFCRARAIFYICISGITHLSV